MILLNQIMIIKYNLKKLKLNSKYGCNKCKSTTRYIILNYSEKLKIRKWVEKYFVE
jgi:hypothetical protein